MPFPGEPSSRSEAGTSAASGGGGLSEAERVRILAESQRQAKERLAEARAEAQRITRNAESAAIKLVLTQQHEAERLLDRQQALLAASNLSPEDEGLLLAEHRKAVELLLHAQGVTAMNVATVVEARVGVVLMNGSREASEILTEALRRVEDGTSAR